MPDRPASVKAFLSALPHCDARRLQYDYLNQLHWTPTIAAALPQLSAAQAWGIVEAALAIDWELGARLAGKLPASAQERAIAAIQAAPLSALYRTYLLGQMRSRATLPLFSFLLACEDGHVQRLAWQGLSLSGAPEAIPLAIAAFQTSSSTQAIALAGSLGCAAAIYPLLQTIDRGSTAAKSLGVEALGQIGLQAVRRYQQRQPYPRDRRAVEVPLLEASLRAPSVELLELEVSGMAGYDVDRSWAVRCLRSRFNEASRDGCVAHAKALRRILAAAGAFDLGSRLRRWWRILCHAFRRPALPSLDLGVAAAAVRALQHSLYCLHEPGDRQRVADCLDAIGGEPLRARWREAIPLLSGSEASADWCGALVELLGRTGDRAAFPLLQAVALRASNPDTRVAAIAALGHLGTAEAVNWAIAAIATERNPAAAQAAIAQLESAIRNPEAIPILLHVLESGTFDAYRMALPMVAELQALSTQLSLLTETAAAGGDREAAMTRIDREMERLAAHCGVPVGWVGFMLAAVRHDTPEAYRLAAREGCRLLESSLRSARQEGNGSLRDMLEGQLTTITGLRQLAANTLARLQAVEACPRCYDILQTEAETLLPRAELARALVQIGGAPREWIAALLCDREAEVVRATLEAIAERPDPAYLSALTPVAGNEHHPQRRTALETLAAIGGDEAATTLLAMLETAPAGLWRSLLARLLAETRSPVGVAWLCEYVQLNPNDSILDRIAAGLGTIGDRAAIPALRLLESSPVSRVRQAANLALVRLGDSAAWEGALAQAIAAIDPDLPPSTQRDLQNQQQEAMAAVLSVATPGHLPRLVEAATQVRDCTIFEQLQGAIARLRAELGLYFETLPTNC